MFPYRSQLCIVIAIFMLVVVRQNAFAGDSGVFKLELPDAAATGMGTAFTGQADRPSAVYFNPAGIVQMDTAQVSAGLTWLQPQMRYQSSAPQNGSGYTANMKEDNFLIPNVFVTTPVFKDKFYVGLGENSNFAGGFSWEADSFSRYATVKDSLVNQDYMIVGAYKINDQWSVGVGATDDQSKFEHDQALAQGASADADDLFKANDNAWGFDLAAMFKLNDRNQFGLSYKSPIHHQYRGTLYLNGLNHGGPDYQTTFGGTTFSTKAIQKLTLPQSFTLGYSLKPANKWTINFDLEWTDWSNYEQQTTYYPNVTSAGQKAVLATGNPQQRSWKSVWSESLGVQYAVTDRFRVRTGYAHHQTPVPKGTFDTEFPDSNSDAVSAGIGYDITSRVTLDIAYVADFYQSRGIVNTVDNSLGAFLNGKYRGFVNIGTMSLTYKF